MHTGCITRERPALPYEKAAEAKGTARKGTKRWHKEQARRRAAERKRAIRNVLALIDSLDARLRRAPGSLKLRFPQHKMTEPRADCPWL